MTNGENSNKKNPCIPKSLFNKPTRVYIIPH